MENIAILTEDQKLHNQVTGIISNEIGEHSSIFHIYKFNMYLDFLRYEIPELVIIDISDPDYDYTNIFEQVLNDPWLETIGFIAITEKKLDDKALEQYKKFNIIFFINKKELEKTLPRMMSVLAKNEEILYHSGIIEKITSASGEIQIDNDINLVNAYASLFSNYLFKEGYIDINKKYSVYLSLSELLINAIEHGNLGISYDEKTELLKTGKPIQDIILEKAELPENVNKKVLLKYKIEQDKSTFIIVDEGEGFDTKNLPDPTDMTYLAEEHGRGIFMTMNSVDKIFYNDVGNEVTSVIVHNGKKEKVIPFAFNKEDELLVHPGDVVFKENERGDSLFYIVSGSYQVKLNNKDIAVLKPSDIFLGEMSFLLSNQRSATVIAKTPGKLVKISREAFTEAIKNYPNYAIFLAKLLAKRLKLSNEKFTI